MRVYGCMLAMGVRVRVCPYGGPEIEMATSSYKSTRGQSEEQGQLVARRVKRRVTEDSKNEEICHRMWGQPDTSDESEKGFEQVS